ncbi:MAG: hypothetical protein E7049_04240 [Lentisphaerae bacterium]|nr:hypothetical protein [Lentisphaerota bacterium]
MKRHLVGIGGVGMSALATALLRLGDEVTGSDRNLETPNIRFLESLGIRCLHDDGSGVAPETDEVIVSTAIEDTNRDLVRARELGIKVVHRASALSAALSGYRLVAVAGTCGKSTVTAMLGHVLAECGFDPMCVNGANVPGWEGAVRFGRGPFAVAEVDESDKSLVAFSPYAAVVTNASADHYSEAEMNEVFDRFTKDVPGPVMDGRRVDYGEVPCSMPGRHNRRNAAIALAMAVALGCDETKARAALMTFRGVERRLQRHGSRVFDDYAHNPEKLRAMWTTLAEECGEGGLCVVWRPHGYAPLRKMMDALAEMFAATIRPQDRLLLLPVYDAGGTTDRSVNSDALAAKLPRSQVELVADHDAALRWISAHRGSFAAFATAGARDPYLAALADRIARATRIGAAVFDFGGVMTTTTMPERVKPIVASLGLPWEAVEQGFARYRRQMDGDFMSMDEMYSRIWKDAGIEVPPDMQAKILEADRASFLYRNEKTLGWMRELKARGFRIGILTNMPSDFARHFRRVFPDFVELADAMVVSGEVKMFKPQRAIYDLLRERIGLPADALCFFDDVEANCIGAREAGWHAIRFSSNEQVAADFEALLAEGT